MIRTLIVCPGRGSYDRAGLGQLQDRSEAAQEILSACDAWRASVGEPTVRALDAEPRYKSTLHVAGEHASLLTFACSLADLAELDRSRHEIVGVVGNSMGFYTALAASGALPLDAAIRLVDVMGRYQRGNVLGGQLLYPLCDAQWRPDPERLQAVEDALAEVRAAGHGAWWSIHLGGHAVLGADAAGLKRLQEILPPIQVSRRTFPLHLPLHSAFHTPLMQGTSERAQRELHDLPFRAPAIPLIDGRGFIFRPRWADPRALADYTLGHQVVEPFDLTLALRTALAHCAPQRVVILGPGNSLGGPIARVLVQSGWGGARDRAAFEARQATDPLLLSFGLAEQRRRLV